MKDIRLKKYRDNTNNRSKKHNQYLRCSESLQFLLFFRFGCVADYRLKTGYKSHSVLRKSGQDCFLDKWNWIWSADMCHYGQPNSVGIYNAVEIIFPICHSFCQQIFRMEFPNGKNIGREKKISIFRKFVIHVIIPFLSCIQKIASYIRWNYILLYIISYM